MIDTPLIVPALGSLYHVLGPWVEALLRFMVGMALVPHGLRMCLGFFKGTGIAVSSVQGVADLFNRKGYRPGQLWAFGVVFTQFVAGPALALGLLTRPMALLVFVLLALSAYDHARYDGYFWNKSGIEYPAMWAAGALYFLVHGGGKISFDNLVLGFEF